MTKALVKKTGETLDVKSMWKSVTVSFDFTFSTDDINVDEVELSDGKTYKKSDLVIGMDNIRDYKIKNITD